MLSSNIIFGENMGYDIESKRLKIILLPYDIHKHKKFHVEGSDILKFI